MDLFKVNKYQAKNENILFMAKIVYENIEKQVTIDGVFERLENSFHFAISPDIESIIILALSFLYGVGLIDVDGKNIRRCERD